MFLTLTIKTLNIGLIVLLTIVSFSCRSTKLIYNDGKIPKVVSLETAKHYEFKLTDLPQPSQTESPSRGSKIIAQPTEAVLNISKGFKINIFAEGNFQNPRWMALAPNGDVFVADSRANSIIVLRDSNKDGIADERFTFSDKLNQPFGMAFHDDWIYVADVDAILRFRYKSGQTQAVGESEKLVTLTPGGYEQHWTRNILFSPDGRKMYVSIGSSGNIDIDSDERRAAINEYDPDGKNHRIYASGIRNPVGLDWNPITGELWTAVNERNGLGDDLVNDYVTSVKDGGFYGFPYVYLGKNIDPRHKNDQKTALTEKTLVPDILLKSHSAPLGLKFYTGKMFPVEYQNDAFVAFHGSWDPAKLTGYKIVRIHFKDGKPVGGYEDFLTGWLPDETTDEVWGRPVGLLVNSDGSLLICDDGARKIWRVSYYDPSR